MEGDFNMAVASGSFQDLEYRQKLEKYLDLNPLLNFVEDLFSKSASDYESADEEDEGSMDMVFDVSKMCDSDSSDGHDSSSEEEMTHEQYIKMLKMHKLSNSCQEGAQRKSKIKEELGAEYDDEESQDSFTTADSPPDMKMKAKRRGRKQAERPLIEVLTMKRRKLWVAMCKKEISKAQKTRISAHKETLAACKKMSHACMKYWRQIAIQNQKTTTGIWVMKRLTREMQGFWKRHDRVERDMRKRQEKEAEEQRRMDVELMEVKRQQRKLNFLITQTELYAHFMSRKLGGRSSESKNEILSKLEEQSPGDSYNSEEAKNKALKNVQAALKMHHNWKSSYEDSDGEPSNLEMIDLSENSAAAAHHAQPAIFKGDLKYYQLKGMNWIANLYDQGINGILADEMGLGKTVQSIAFFAHVTEHHGVWGPFLVVAPASTLHNWHSEFSRFVPIFKVIPYWGNPSERKVLRTFWEQKHLHSREASYHVVITSYQLLISDVKYLNRIKWHYMILDEAQAIKSTSSQRWKQLLGFQCRNRLLLSGTPIQNSMHELWALLHFIMPSLFDSHQEFQDWFAKDIESHAENKTAIDQVHLSRLHMILSPFMLRRVKKDVEHELSDKIEVLVHCDLTARQKLLYHKLKTNIRIDDLDQDTTTLMNLVMQFRKVCNHPELLEKREAKSPFFFRLPDYHLPKKIFEEAVFCRQTLRHRWKYNLLNIFSPANFQKSAFQFLRLIGLGISDCHRYMQGTLDQRWLLMLWWLEVLRRLRYSNTWEDHATSSSPFVTRHRLLIPRRPPPAEFLFTSTCSRFYTHSRHTLFSTPESVEHRLLRSKKQKHCITSQPEENLAEFEEETSQSEHLVSVFPHIPRPPQILEMVPTELPIFFTSMCPKASSHSVEMVCSDRSFAWWQHDLKRASHRTFHYGSSELAEQWRWRKAHLNPLCFGGLLEACPRNGYSNVVLADKETLIRDAGKLMALDGLLKRLKEQGHRVLIYSQMTKMIDLLEAFMWHRRHTFMRLDGSSKIAERRDMVADFQTRSDIFVFLLSTRAGGLGINLTAADTVIFYDSDWNPTVDQQAMDRAHRLGQTKQVTVYRLICEGTIEERILQRAKEKSEIQRMVISGGEIKPDVLKPKEVVSLLLDDAEIEKQYRSKQAERKAFEEQREQERKRRLVESKISPKKVRLDGEDAIAGVSTLPLHLVPPAGIEIRGRPTSGRGSGRRGRPRGVPGRPRVIARTSSTMFVPTSGIRRGPGRPRSKHVSPANVGRRMPRPPLVKPPDFPEHSDYSSKIG